MTKKEKEDFIAKLEKELAQSALDTFRVELEEYFGINKGDK